MVRLPLRYAYSHSSSTLRPSASTLALVAGILATVLTVANVAVTIRAVTRLQQLLPVEHTYSYVGDDRPWSAPIATPPVEVMFEDLDPRFGLRDDDDWGTLFPTDGSVRAGGAASNRTFLVAMMHELHCLDVIRVALVTNRSDLVSHSEHCLRYMLQAVHCAADTTLEEDEMILVDGEWMHAVYAYKARHRCRDRTQLSRFLVEMEGRPEIPQGPSINA